MASCEKFLDMPETEDMTFEKIWQTRVDTEGFLKNIYHYINHAKDENSLNPQHAIEQGGSDESVGWWANGGSHNRYVNVGDWSPSNARGARHDRYYDAVRKANIFLQNADKAKDIPDLPGYTVEAWKVEARFLRAYFYCELMKQYGPVVLLKDRIIESNLPSTELAFERNTWDECMEWITVELTETAAQLPINYDMVASELGKPTKAAALSILARMKLYSARELFNGNELYAGVTNSAGVRLFPEYNQQKWQDAADAGKVAIDAVLEAKRGLHTIAGDPYQAYHDIFFDRDNKEIIWGMYISTGSYAQHSIPRSCFAANTYGGFAPTQQQVDAYAMKNGYYPIVGYGGKEFFLNQRGSGGDGLIGNLITDKPVIDPRSNYSEEGFASNFRNPALFVHEDCRVNATTSKMYVDREPRFYMHVALNNAYYPLNYKKNGSYVKPTVHAGGIASSTNGGHSRSGYLSRKFLDHSTSLAKGSPSYPKINWPIIRAAEVYLNYCEALVEADKLSDAVTEVNSIRRRAGVPELGVDGLYAAEIQNKAELRELIRCERRVELAFETSRYYDVRQWRISEVVNTGNFYSLNIQSKNSDFKTKQQDPNTFWQRVDSREGRVFTFKHYLYPFAQSELIRNTDLVQNFGW